MFGLDTGLTVLLIACIVAAGIFEFINGFHDTANAVATVIYTNTLKPTFAVIWSGIWNFIGVLRGGIDVAMGIVVLLPLESVISQSPGLSVAMVIAILLAAILWNLGTWYLGIPCSSSHTLIGSIIGVGLAFQFMPENVLQTSINWGTAGDIGLSLLFSPLIGMLATMVLMYIGSKLITNKTIFHEPTPGKVPPFWIRAILIGTCTGVSFAHGNNDGQKGVGLIMVILIALVPMQFALDHQVDLRKVQIDLADTRALLSSVDSTRIKEEHRKKYGSLLKSAEKASVLIGSKAAIDELSKEDQIALRSSIASLSKNSKSLLKSGSLPLSQADEGVLKSKVKSVQKLTDYAPFWVTILISTCLGLGTMVGWKRIVVTIGERIGKSHLTYAQGASAELVAAGTIYAASAYGLPVSTTQVLTSAVAGSMVASSGSQNLQRSTIVNIAIAWILTLPVCILVAGGLFDGLAFLAR